MINRKKKPSDATLEAVARVIHNYIALPTIAMYYDMMKLVKDDTPPEEREAASIAVNNMMITAESLYDNLTDQQKELMKKLALDLIEIAKN